MRAVVFNRKANNTLRTLVNLERMGDWIDLRRKIFLVAVVISTLFGAQSMLSGWYSYKAERRVERDALEDFTAAAALHLSVVNYRTVALLSEAQLKRPETAGVSITDRFGLRIFSKGVTRAEADANPGDYTVHVSEASNDPQNMESIVVVTVDSQYTEVIYGAVLRSVAILIVTFLVSTLLFASYVSQYITSPLYALSQAMAATRRTGEYIEVAETSNTQMGRLARIFNDMQRDSARRREELEAALQAAARANQAKNSFLANMSHELRSPLNAIIGFSQMLVARDALFGSLSGDKITEYAKSIANSGDHLLQIVNSLLDLSRIEHGAYRLNKTWFDVGEVLNSIGELIDANSDGGWLTIELRRVNEDVEDMRLYADVTAFRQVLVNVISNARRHNTPDTRVRIVVEAAPEQVTLSISDTGSGMTQQQVSRALQPFVQLNENNPTVASGGGAGLGLPLARALVEEHGGTFEIDSARNLGTTVRVTYPLPRADDDADADAACAEMDADARAEADAQADAQADADARPDALSAAETVAGAKAAVRRAVSESAVA